MRVVSFEKYSPEVSYLAYSLNKFVLSIYSTLLEWILFCARHRNAKSKSPCHQGTLKTVGEMRQNHTHTHTITKYHAEGFNNRDTDRSEGIRHVEAESTTDWKDHTSQERMFERSIEGRTDGDWGKSYCRPKWEQAQRLGRMRCFEGTLSCFCTGAQGTYPCSNSRPKWDPKGMCNLLQRTTKGTQVGRKQLTLSPPTGSNLVEDKEMCFLLKEHSRIKYLKCRHKNFFSNLKVYFHLWIKSPFVSKINFQRIKRTWNLKPIIN